MRLLHSRRETVGLHRSPLWAGVCRSLSVLLVCGLWSAWACAAGSAEPTVMVVRSEGTMPYQEAAEGMASELRRDVDVLDLPQYNAQWATALSHTNATSISQTAGAPPAGMPRLVVALGTPACAQVVRTASAVAVLCTLLPRSSFEQVLRNAGRRAGPSLSVIYLNQPYTRQIDLIRLALPEAKQVGVVWSAETAAAESGLEAVIQSRGLRLLGATTRADESVFNAFKRVLSDADVLLALADPQVYNSGSIQNILLTSFRAQIPMVAFSPAYGRAGALLAIYATPTQLGHQAGAWAKAVLQGQGLPSPAYPQAFEISVNDNVARSLGLRVNAAELTERLRRLEQGP